MKTQMVINIHSFVDLITNSSSEIYVYASDGTVKAVKDLINNLLKGVGSDKTADDLFTFDVGVDIDNPETRQEVEARGGKYTWEITVSANSPEGKAAIEEHRGDYPKQTSLIVAAKEGTPASIALAASTLANLTGLFDMESCYNG
jgi:hypothetical protein